MDNDVFNRYVTRVDSYLESVIQQAKIPAPRIKEAILYTLFPGGKRLRPLLVYMSGDLVNASIERLDVIAAAIELTHCYSLVHDDLPAMDNDDYRRGKLSCHRAFDEATAILAGDGMQALAVDFLLTQLPQYLAHDNVLAITRELVKASGPEGMVSGQSMDLTELAKADVEEARVHDIHRLKTGKLITACIKTALLAGEPSEQATHALTAFVDHLGLVFQMQDDYLDRYHTNVLGKARASDAANHKTTYATLFSQHELHALIRHHYQSAHEALSVFGSRSDDLSLLLDCLQYRMENTPDHSKC